MINDDQQTAEIEAFLFALATDYDDDELRDFLRAMGVLVETRLGGFSSDVQTI